MLLAEVLISNTGQETNRAELKTLARMLGRAVKNELTERQRTCIALYYGERRTVPEIGILLGLTRGTVSKHIHKGLDRLRRAMRYCTAAPENPGTEKIRLENR